MTRSPAAAQAGKPVPSFDPSFCDTLADLIAWRRDVRRFRGDAVDPGLLDALLDLACLAPSVGNSQPWRFVTVEAAARRAGVLEIFRTCNDAALTGYGVRDLRTVPRTDPKLRPRPWLVLQSRENCLPSPPP